MNILFFGYWGANEGLSQSTINPHLEILCQEKKIKTVTYISIERKPQKIFNIPESSKIKHLPYYSTSQNRIFAKSSDFIFIPVFLKKTINSDAIDLLMCRSSLAGSIGYLAHLLTKTPFTVESYEPHADYMASLGIWDKHGISHWIQSQLETRQKKSALHIMPVSHGYREELVKNGMDNSKITVVPCVVDINKFSFSNDKRSEIRNQLNIDPETKVGVYIGKFGDIYWDKDAFKLFKSAIEFFKDFHLIILTPSDHNLIKSRLNEYQIDSEQAYIGFVGQNDIPAYLSASDMAFSLHKTSIISHAFSPIKNGEYWANGLPIVSSAGIGDDSEIIENENGGMVINDLNQVNWNKLLPYIDNHKTGKGTQILAKKYRNDSIVKTCYSKIISIISSIS